ARCRAALPGPDHELPHTGRRFRTGVRAAPDQTGGHMNEQVLVATDSRGVATVTLNRPEKHNAFDADIIATLTQALQTLDRDAAVRIVVLTGAGKSFSAGADLGWMKAMARYSEAENLEDSLRLAELMQVLDKLRKPTIARINGHVFEIGRASCRERV